MVYNLPSQQTKLVVLLTATDFSGLPQHGQRFGSHMLNLVSSGPLGKRGVHIFLEKALCTCISDLNGASGKSGKQRQVFSKERLVCFWELCIWVLEMGIKQLC